MNRVEPLLAQDGRRMGRQSLIEEDSSHATRSVLRRSSSTVAAA
jgi:hypothetical protein